MGVLWEPGGHPELTERLTKRGGQAAGGLDPVDNALAVRVLVVGWGAVKLVSQRVPVLA